VDTLFIGGGTPTYLPPRHLKRLLVVVLNTFPLAGGHEFTVEANPSDLDEERAGLLAESGVTRVSLGAQSFDTAKLHRLDREHTPEQIIRSFEIARRLAPSVSLDLIFGVPEETTEVWERDLASALKLSPHHVSTYGLTYERGTALWGAWRKGRVRQVGEEIERAMFERAIDVFSDAGFEHYEVSNFSRPGHRCRHNEVYWSGGSYYAAGPGAARYVDGRREINHRSTTTYLKRVLSGQSPVAESEMLAPEDRARETLVIGLRRMRGIHRQDFARQTGLELDALAGSELGRFIQQGLLQQDGDWVRLTREGLFVSDSIWPYLLSSDTTLLSGTTRRVVRDT
jgi:oxygen-independent coproporphyrinogen-3 oxidase